MMCKRLAVREIYLPALCGLNIIPHCLNSEHGFHFNSLNFVNGNKYTTPQYKYKYFKYKYLKMYVSTSTKYPISA